MRRLHSFSPFLALGLLLASIFLYARASSPKSSSSHALSVNCYYITKLIKDGVVQYVLAPFRIDQHRRLNPEELSYYPSFETLLAELLELNSYGLHPAPRIFYVGAVCNSRLPRQNYPYLDLDANETQRIARFYPKSRIVSRRGRESRA